jgi:enterobactin synthetase component D
MSSPDAPAAWSLLQPWMPSGVAWCWRRVAGGEILLSGLDGHERAAIARALPRRQAEFATGRWCARNALVALGLAPVGIPVGAKRAPVWPEGVVGSISHDDEWCVAGAALRQDCAGLGVDIERLDRFRTDMERLVATPRERERLAKTQTPEQRLQALAGLFSAKEAAFKALHLAAAEWIDFQDAELVDWPQAPAGPLRLQLLRAVGPWPALQPFHGALAIDDGRVLALMALPAAVPCDLARPLGSARAAKQ